LVGVVAVALSVLILHQLSLNHPTAAGKQLSAPTHDTSTDTTPRLSMMTNPVRPRLGHGRHQQQDHRAAQQI
jgi:hypothetical protein